MRRKTMRFMILRKADENTEAGMLPTQELLAAMGRYVEAMSAAGVLLGGDGLQPTAKGVRVKFRRGKPAVMDGPFTETKEVLAGYLVIKVASRQEAIDWAKRWPTLDGDGEVELELRPLVEAEDFGPEFTSGMQEIKDHMPADADKRGSRAAAPAPPCPKPYPDRKSVV